MASRDRVSPGLRRARQLDEEFFRTHPTARTYERAAVPGEVPQPLPPGARVCVQRFGLTVVRAFFWHDNAERAN